MARFQTVFVLALICGVFATECYGRRIVRDASPESEESKESDESKEDPLHKLLKSFKKYAEGAKKDLETLAVNGHESTKKIVEDATKHLTQGIQEIQENIAKIKGDPAAVGEQLMDKIAKQGLEIATKISKTVEDLKKDGAAMATNAIDKVVENSKKLTETANKAIEDASKAPEPAAGA